MSRSLRFVLPALAILLSLMCQAQQAMAQVVRPGATNLILYNAANNDVTVFVKTPNTSTGINQDGCPDESISMIKWIDVTNGGTGPLNSFTQFQGGFQGWFTLKRGHKAQLLNVGINPHTGQVSSCFQTLEVGFGALPLLCPIYSGTAPYPNTTPGPSFNALTAQVLPNGSNGFECTLNVPGTAQGQTILAGTTVPTNETCDISCLNGCNSKIVMQLIPPAGGPFWQVQVGSGSAGVPAQNQVFKTPVSTQNSWVDVTKNCDDNCVDPATGYARPGVYPFGCSTCNVFPDGGIPCAVGAHRGQFCAARNGLPPMTGCLFARPPQFNGTRTPTTPSTDVPGIPIFGGSLLVTYMGPLSPPGTCR